VTLTTVGYGDTAPVTALGRVFGAITAVIGIGLVALPSGILAGGFVEAFAREEEAAGGSESPGATCPHCGGSLDHPPDRGSGP
jgi:voltage-gated potassium channel